MKEEFQEIRSIYNHGRDHVGISAVLIDPIQDLVWAGNQSVSLDKFGRNCHNISITISITKYLLFFLASLQLYIDGVLVLKIISGYRL